jgi:hypothetical protein
MLDRLEDVFASLRRHEVRYLTIGGIAAVLHGVPRATFDLDVLIDPTPGNARRLLAAFQEAGLGTAALTTAEELAANEITIFKDRIRIDVLTSAPGIAFEEAWERRQVMRYRDQDFFVVSRDDLIASKRASGRAVDLEDLKALGASTPE